MQNKSIEDIVIATKNAHKTSVYGSILDCIYIKQIPYYFKYFDLFEKRAKILLPIVFEELDKAVVENRYPGPNSPQIVFSDGENIECTFTISENDLSEDDIDKVADESKKLFLKAHTCERFLEEGKIRNAINQFSWFAFNRATLKGYVYVYIFITTSAGKMVIGTFSCPSEMRELWAPVMKEMMCSYIDE